MHNTCNLSIFLVVLVVYCEPVSVLISHQLILIFQPDRIWVSCFHFFTRSRVKRDINEIYPLNSHRHHHPHLKPL
jgi:hypothetical protein